MSMKHGTSAAIAALLVVTAGCATDRSAQTTVVSSEASPGVSATTSTAQGTAAAHPWSAGVIARGSGPIHVGHPWTAQWNMPTASLVPAAQTSPAVAAPAPATTAAPTTATPAAAPIAAPAPAPAAKSAPAREAPRKRPRSPRRSRG